MPGIFGIISNREKGVNEQELASMHMAVANEKFYNTGSYSCNELGVYVGWTCLKDSFSDCMPVKNEKKDIVLIYSGENFKEIAEINELKGRNHQFSKRNASYLVHMYEEWKDDFFSMLNGRFNGLLIDLREKKAIIFNDRFGLQKIHFYENSDSFYFASETKAILSLFPEMHNVDTRSLEDIFAFSFITADKSIFREISVIPGGSYWVFKNRNISYRGRYFKNSELDREPYLDKEFHKEKLLYVLKRILGKYFKSDEKLGVKITRDLELPAILSNAMFSPEKVPCFVAGGSGLIQIDVKIARRISDYTGLKIYVVEADDNFFKSFYVLAQRVVEISNGNVDITAVVDLNLYMMARKVSSGLIMGSQLSGTFRDCKLIKGNQINVSFLDSEFRSNVINSMDSKAKFLEEKLSSNICNRIAWAGGDKIGLGQSQMNIRTPLLDNDIVDLMCRVPHENSNIKDLLLALNSSGVDFFSESRTGLKTYFKTFYNSIKINNRRANRCYCEELNSNNNRQFCSWYRKELSTLVKDILYDNRSLDRSYIDKKVIKKFIDDHIQGKQNYTKEITLLLTVELIYRVFIDQK